MCTTNIKTMLQASSLPKTKGIQKERKEIVCKCEEDCLGHNIKTPPPAKCVLGEAAAQRISNTEN